MTTAQTYETPGGGRLSQIFAFDQLRMPLPPSATGAAWLSEFRMASVARARGSGMEAVLQFEAAVERSAPIATVQSSFLTSCVVLGSNLDKLEYARLLDEADIKRARAAIVDLQDETTQAYARLGEAAMQAVALDTYADMATSAQARLTALYGYLDSVTKKWASQTLPSQQQTITHQQFSPK